MSMASEAVEDNPWTLPGLLAWRDAFETWVYLNGYALAGTGIPPGQFYPLLNEFLTNDSYGLGQFYQSDIVFDANGEIEGPPRAVSLCVVTPLASRYLIYSVGLKTANDYVASITTTREVHPPLLPGTALAPLTWTERGQCGHPGVCVLGLPRIL